MLHLICSKRGGGKTTFCLNSLSASFKQGKKAAFLVPEQLSLAMEGKVIETIGFVGGGIEVFSFNRLFHRLYNLSNREKRVYMDNVGKTMLINRILETYENDFTIFKPGGASCSGLLSVISEFKRHFADEKQLFDAKNAFESNLSKQKFTEFALLLEKYNESVENSRADSTDNLTLMPELIKNSDYLSDFSFYIDGFDGFTPQETAVITALSEEHEVYITLTYEKSRAYLFSPIEKTVTRLENACKEENIPCDITTLEDKGNESYTPALNHLRHFYGSFSAPAFEGYPSGISVFTADTPYSEMAAVARCIVKLTKDNMRYRDIFVLVPDLNSYLPVIEKVFADHNLPYFADSRKDILYHPLTRLLLSLCDIFISSFNTQSVFSFLKNPLIPIPAAEIDALEFYALEAGVEGADWKKEWTSAPNESYDLPALNRTRKAFLNLITPFREETKGRTDCAVFSDAFKDFLLLCGADKTVNRRIKQLPAAEMQTEMSIWTGVMEVLDQLKLTLGGTKLGIEKVRSALLSGFNSCTVGVIPPTFDHITVSTADRNNFQNAKALFLPGATEGAFPIQSHGSGMITDKEREILEKQGIVLSASNREKALFSPFAVYMTLTVPKQKLFISYPITAIGGEGVAPASVLQNLFRMFPNLKTVPATQSLTNQTVSLPKATLPYFLRTEEPTDLKREVYGWYLENEEWNRQITRLLDSENYTLSWNISRETAERLWKKTLYTTISRLEKFASCPLSFFLNYGLKLNERKVHSFSPPEAGNMMHAVMEHFVKNAIDEKADWNALTFADVKEKTLALCNEEIARQTALFPSVTNRYAFLLSRIKTSTVNAMWAVVHHIKAGIFKPYAAEYVFKDETAVHYTTDNGNELVLSGKIDRIDTSSTGGYRIIDYKSGEKDLSLSSVASGRSLQLPIYSCALKDKLNHPRGMFYLTVDAPLIARDFSYNADEPDEKLLKEYKLAGYAVGDSETLLEMDKDMGTYSSVIPARHPKGKEPTSSRLLSDAEYQKIEEMAIRKVKEFGDQILSGTYPILPVEQERYTACSYCPYRSVCRFDAAYCQTKLEETVSDDALLGREAKDNE